MLGYNVIHHHQSIFMVMPFIRISGGPIARRILQIFVLLLAGDLARAEPLNLVGSIRPLTLLAQDLTQGLPVTVTTLLPANADPHSWALRISDRQVLADADLVLWLGPEFEAFLAKPLTKIQQRQMRLGELPDLLWATAEADHHDHHQHLGRDLHIWLNPANAVVIQKALAAKLAEQRPDWQAQLQLRLRQQVEQLEQLQAEIKERLLPYRGRGFIAYHDAYGHFVEAFDLRQLGAVNQSSEQQLSAKALQNLRIQAQGAHCLMAERNGKQEQRMAQLLNLPLVVADGLARDADLQTTAGFLLGMGVAFEACFAKDEKAAS